MTKINKKDIINRAQFEKINVKKIKVPNDYHCSCTYCSKFLGLLIRKDNTKYSRIDRRKYYSPEESGYHKGAHGAKTPLHLARFCVQQFSKENDWVLDPTIGAGTTAVEALLLKRNVVGIEIEYTDLIEKNISMNNLFGKKYSILEGDVRDIDELLFGLRSKFSLIINNPPYSADESQKGYTNSNYTYDKSKNNLAFLKEGNEYWNILNDIYTKCIKYLKRNGYFIIGVKDMMRKKKPFLLHKYIGDILDRHLEYCGMYLLPHYPTTLFMNTYLKRYTEVEKIPMYQTILVFKKKIGGKKIT